MWVSVLLLLIPTCLHFLLVQFFRFWNKSFKWSPLFTLRCKLFFSASWCDFLSLFQFILWCTGKELALHNLFPVLGFYSNRLELMMEARAISGPEGRIKGHSSGKAFCCTGLLFTRHDAPRKKLLPPWLTPNCISFPNLLSHGVLCPLGWKE